MSKESSSSSGVGFLGFLCLLFIGLKLTHFIDWSWWWITAPVWIPAGLVVLGLAGYGIILLLERKKKRVTFEAPKDTFPGNNSKFMKKLNEAMEASEKKRNEKLN